MPEFRALDQPSCRPPDPKNIKTRQQTRIKAYAKMLRENKGAQFLRKK